jgi:hypothetical protein
MISNDVRLVRNTAVTILALVALRLGAAAQMGGPSFCCLA